MSEKIVFIGCGKIATQSAQALQNDGAEVLAVRRNTHKLPSSLLSHAADTTQPSSLEFLKALKPNTVVYSVTADSFNLQSYTSAYLLGLQNVIAACSSADLKRLIFVSSTAVYHQDDDSIVDESSATQPQRFNGQVMLQAEKLAINTGVGTCLRFSGIYGPGRTRMIDRVRNGQCTTEQTDGYSNRIHAADCAGILKHLILLSTVPEIIIGTDSAPVKSSVLESYIADQLGIEKTFNNNPTSQPKRIAGSKQCSNQLLLSTGYKLTHPDYCSGYSAQINS